MRQLFVLLLFIAGGAGLVSGDAVKPVNTDRKNVAVKGYDVVAYFTENRPVQGSTAFAHGWNGAVWHFASATNRDRFAADPEAYAPQFGGYCSYAVSRNYTADIDPRAFSIVNGKLYLNYSLSVRTKWEAERDLNIAKAEANWPGLSGRKGAK